MALIFFGKVKYGKVVERKLSWKVLKIFAQEYSNDDLRMTLSFFCFFLLKVKFASWAFYMGRMKNSLILV